MHDKYIDQYITTIDVSTSIFLQKTFRLHNFPFSDRAVHASNAHVRAWRNSQLIYALILEMHCCACIEDLSDPLRALLVFSFPHMH